ncbi:hypothetical protein Dimus_002393 [Dionaea muscipula]
MMREADQQLAVPPGFRFHPTDEELLCYYLKKKVSFEAIDLDVIREVDLNKLEPWDLKDRCRIGSGPQNEWYFFSHKDKKYPTGTRTNRATAAGFWKATGRDKAIYNHTNSDKIGMRKTLVFYTGRAPHGHKTDWIMHEYRLLHLHDNNHHHHLSIHHDNIIQEDGWVVCRVFRKKNHPRGGYLQRDDQAEADHQLQEQNPSSHNNNNNNMKPAAAHAQAAITTTTTTHHPFATRQQQQYHLQHYLMYGYNTTTSTSSNLDGGSLQLPQLSSPDSVPPPPPPPPFLSMLPAPSSLGTMEVVVLDDQCSSQNLLRLTSSSAGGGSSTSSTGLILQQPPAAGNNIIGGEWSFLDKLLVNYQGLEQQQQQQQPENKCQAAADHDHHKLPFPYLGCPSDVLKFPK